MIIRDIKNDWIDIKHKIKAQWEKLSDNEIEDLKDNFNSLLPKIQKAYGTAKEHAEKEFHEFKKTISHMLHDDKSSPTVSDTAKDDKNAPESKK